MDRGNPLRGQSPRFVFVYTLVFYGAALAGFWLIFEDDPADAIGLSVMFTVFWFNWVWRA